MSIFHVSMNRKTNEKLQYKYNLRKEEINDLISRLFQRVRNKEINDLISRLSQKVKNHSSLQAESPLDWGYVGDLSLIKEQLENI